MKRVLVTGATGFIGRQTLLQLLDLGYDVHAIYHFQPIETDPRIVWHKANLLEDAAAGIIFEIRSTHLLHFAWYVNPSDYKDSPENARWADASIELLHAFEANGGARAVFAGSAMEYDPGLIDDFRNEDSQTADHNAYASAKNETRRRAESFAKDTGISFAWGRIFNLYGPHESPLRLVPQVINSVLDGKKPTIFAGGAVLDYSYVSDVSNAFVALLESDLRGTVNIASGSAISLKEMANSIAKLMDRPDLVQNVNDTKPSAGPVRVVADIARLKMELHFVPQYDLQSGLEQCIDWWRKERSTPAL